MSDALPRAATLDGAGALRLAYKQEAFMGAMYKDVPVRHHKGQLYGMSQLQALHATESAAATTFPVLSTPAAEFPTLAQLLEKGAKPKAPTPAPADQ